MTVDKSSLGSLGLSTSGYELVAAPEISFTKFSPDNQTASSEIWVAVKKMK